MLLLALRWDEVVQGSGLGLMIWAARNDSPTSSRIPIPQAPPIHTSGGILTIDGELEGSEGADHEETGTDTSVRALKAELLGDLDETGSGGLAGSTRGLRASTLAWSAEPWDCLGYLPC